jgi:hypothetical protein
MSQPLVRLTYTRAEWAVVAEMVGAANPRRIPPGLAQRINALLRATPGFWPDEMCVLDLEPENAATVRLLLAQSRGVTGAEHILSTHQRGNATATYRMELRTGGVSSVVAYVSDVSAIQQELEEQAARLRAVATTGELVVIDQATGEEHAHLPLLPEPGTGQASS